MTGPTDVLEPLGERSATLYVVAGALLAVFATNSAARVFADAGVEVVHSTLGPAGFLVGLVGLVGLAPALTDRTPRLATVAVAVALVPLAGWFAITVAGIGTVLGATPGASVLLPGPAFPLVFLTTVLAYFLVAAASLRVGVHSRTVGVLLLAPALTFLALIVGVVVVGPASALEVPVDAGHALGHLAIGAALRTDGAPSARADPAADATP